MSHVISGLLWNTCIAGGLATLIFLAQRTRYLRVRPHVCHALWLLVLVKLISPAFVAIPVSIGSARSAQDRSESLAVAAPAIGASTSGSAGPIQTGVRGEEAIAAQIVDVMLTSQFAVAVSVIGSLALFLAIVLRMRPVARLVRHSEPASEWIQDRVAVASRQLGLKRVPSVRMAHGKVPPFLWVAWQGPRIILPSRFISTVELESVELIIKHELAHYARRDHWTNYFATTLAVSFWWNPVVWWARRELRIQQEWSCDRMVLSQDCGQRVRYAETLLAAVDFVAPNDATCPAPATAFGGCNALKRRIEMIVSNHSLPFTSNRAFIVLFALIVLPLGIANAEEEKEDWSATRREFVERIEEFTREIEELRIEGDDIGVKHLAGQRDYLKGILPILDEILKAEQEHEKAKAGKDLEGARQFEAKLEALEGKFWRAERIGEMEGGLAELKILKKELAEEGDDKGRQRVEAFVADQEKLLKLVRDLHKIVEIGDDKKTEKLEKQIDRHEESLGLRIEEFHLERHIVEERQEGEDVRELEAELKEVRKRLRELDRKSK